MKRKEEDPLMELRRYRDAVAKKFNYDGDAIAEYIRSVPLLPGQKWATPPDEEKQPRAKRSAAAKPKKAASRKPARKKSSTHA